jgi:hypothetical protein
MRKLILILLVAAGIFHLPPQAIAADSELGISLQVLKGGEGSSANINKTNRLWFVIEPGKSDKRDVLVNSASDITQKINLSIAGRSQVNGELRYDSEAVTVVDQWVEFSANDFLLEPGQSRLVTVTINVPLDAVRQVFQPALLVNSVSPAEEESTNKTPTALQVSQGIFLGVGTDEDFRTSFTIDDVLGETVDLGKVLRVKLSNTGETPIAIEGELQLSSATFFGYTIGPLIFYTPTINPGESGFGEIIVGEDVPEDRYRIQVRASQGFITETRNFEKNIDFPNLVQWYNFLIWGAVILVALIVAILSIRFLRRTSSAIPLANRAPKPRANKVPKPRVEQVPETLTVTIPKPRVEQVPETLTVTIPKPRVEQVPQASTELVPKLRVEQVLRLLVDKVMKPRANKVPKPRVEPIPRPSTEIVPKARVEQVQRPRYEQVQRPRYEQVQRPRYEQVQRPRYEQVQRPRYEQVPRQNERYSSPKVTSQPKPQQPKKRRQFKNLAILFLIYVFKEGKKKLFLK